jgi:hypothetical protein
LCICSSSKKKRFRAFKKWSQPSRTQQCPHTNANLSLWPQPSRTQQCPHTNANPSLWPQPSRTQQCPHTDAWPHTSAAMRIHPFPIAVTLRAAQRHIPCCAKGYIAHPRMRWTVQGHARLYMPKVKPVHAPPPPPCESTPLHSTECDGLYRATPEVKRKAQPPRPA